MTTYDMTEMIGWARRVAGDQVGSEFEEIEAEGQSVFTISSDGFTEVTAVTVDSVALSAGDYTASGIDVNIITPPAVGAVVRVTYDAAAFTDGQIGSFLSDAANEVIADLHLHAYVDETDFVDENDTLVTDGRLHPQIARLIALKAAINARGDLTNTAADDAITVRDGDTSIDLSKGAWSGEKVMARLQMQYKEAMTRAATARFVGRSTRPC